MLNPDSWPLLRVIYVFENNRTAYGSQRLDSCVWNTNILRRSRVIHKNWSSERTESNLPTGVEIKDAGNFYSVLIVSGLDSGIREWGRHWRDAPQGVNSRRERDRETEDPRSAEAGSVCVHKYLNMCILSVQINAWGHKCVRVCQWTCPCMCLAFHLFPSKGPVNYSAGH